MQARIAGAGHRSPASVPLIEEDDVVEVVDRFETQDERGITVLFQDHRREERRLEAVGAAGTHDPAETPERRAPVWFLVVRQLIQIALDIERRPEARDQPSLGRRERPGTPAVFIVLRRTESGLSRHRPSRACRRAPDPDSTRFPYR